ncbi:hypothetical protein CISIN_1g0464512mg, partial [Citrus sinensis]
NSQHAPVHGVDQSKYGMVDSSQQYYQEPVQSPLHQSVPGGTYGDNYQQPLGPYSNGRGYGASAAYQPAPQPGLFIPPQATQPNFTAPAPAPVTSQPAMRPFIPSTPPVLRNAEQYQQPTLGSQLYPGVSNPGYPVPPVSDARGSLPSQIGAVPGPKMPNVVAPTPTPTGFMPMSGSGVVQRPGMGSMQPASPQSVPVQPAVTPAAPPPTIQTVDTSNVPAHQKPVINTLTRLFNETSEALGGSRANPAKKREIEDNSRKIGALFAKLNSGDISKNAADKLVQLCQALDNNDFGTALQIQVLLTTSDWDECNFWLATLKRMIKTRQNVRLS